MLLLFYVFYELRRENATAVADSEDDDDSSHSASL